MQILTDFKKLDAAAAQDMFLKLASREQAELLLALPLNERRLWVRALDPADAADLVQEMPAHERAGILELLDWTTRNEVNVLLAYEEDVAGGLMSPRYCRVRPDMTAAQAVSYVQKQGVRGAKTINYVYVLDNMQRLLGVVTIREILSAPADKKVSAFMRTDLVTVGEQMGQEELSRLFGKHSLMAIPVVAGDGTMKGIVTVDDIVDVVEQEATEDIQKLGGSEALDQPYLTIGLGKMIRKRAVWLTVLFFGELLTASAMGFFEHQLASALVLALFLPLIISSGGNSGSQAATLVIRAMALGEVTLSDWWRVLRREILTGLALGGILAAIGLARVFIWQAAFDAYGAQYVLVGLTVSLSLIAVVLWGTFAGSILPFLLRKLRFDPASACTPLVATLVDVTGVIIYFSIASVVLLGGR
ncbi:MAG TPA: magnesium transporter [Candidatus Obscuribacterales bacterium]